MMNTFSLFGRFASSFTGPSNLQTKTGKPDLLEELLGRAHQHYDEHRWGDVIRCCLQALDADPRLADALVGLGVAYYALDQVGYAVRFFQRALQLEPDNIGTLHNQARVLAELKRFDEAAANYQRIVTLKPDDGVAWLGLGVCWHHLSNMRSAIDCYVEAQRCQPALPSAYTNLGLAFFEIGDSATAINWYRKALTIAPASAEALYMVALLEQHTSYSDDIRAMEALFLRDALNDLDRMHIAFGLAKAYEDLRDYKRAFACLGDGNRLRRAMIDYSITNDQRDFEAIKQGFPLGSFRPDSSPERGEDLPIFIVGMPRSGTSLVEQILASHPEVFGAGELPYLAEAVQAGCLNCSDRSFPDAIPYLAPSDYRDIASMYVKRLREHAPDARRITDKMPNNFVYIGLILRALPNARIVHCVRDPMDTCFSIYKTSFGASGHGYAYDLKELAAYYRLYNDLMEHWKSVVPWAFYEIRYENLVSNTTQEVRNLLTYCGLDWNESCLYHFKTKRRVATRSANQVCQPIYQSSVQSWRSYESELGELHEALFQQVDGFDRAAAHRC